MWPDQVTTAPAHDSPGEEDTPGMTWEPIDLGPFLRGEITRPEPDIGVMRSDGIRLLYPGKEHSVIGEMECGKSWFATACIASELTSGKNVVYIHFEEADPIDTVQRLQALGVPDETILERLRFVGPEEPVTPERLTRLLNPAPTLVVLDGVNEAMSLHGWGIREEDGAAAYRRRLVKPCTRVGAAVLSADHVVKDKEKRDRGPLGSIHKGNGLSGSLILLENADPFGRGMRGISHVYITKDRPGFLRRNGRPTKTPGKTFMGELVVDDTRTFVDYLELKLWAPREEDATDEPKRGTQECDDEMVMGAVKSVIASGHPATITRIRARSVLRGVATDSALERLVMDGRLKEEKGPRNSRVFTVSQDQSSETAEDAS